MLDPRFKDMHIITSFVGYENVINWVLQNNNILVIEELQVPPAQVDSKDLFHTIEANLDTLNCLVSIWLNKFHPYLIDMHCKCALNWWLT
jgi:hypothetical protein